MYMTNPNNLTTIEARDRLNAQADPAAAIGGWVGWERLDMDRTKIQLDGEFTAAELEEIIQTMRRACEQPREPR